MTDLNRRYLLVLLLRSYLDAQPGLHRSGDTAGIRSAFGSRSPAHTGEARSLWKQGSYAALDTALSELQNTDMGLYHALYITYIYQPPRRPSNVSNHEKKKQHYAVKAEQALRWLERRMPERIWCPKDIVENAGHVRRPA